MTLHDLKLACPAYNMLAQDGVCERCRNGKVHNVLLHRCIKGSSVLSAIVMVEALLHRVLHTFQLCVDKFVVPSQFYINKLVEWGWSRECFSYVPNAVDGSYYQPEYIPGKSFTYFGRLSREKGVATLIKAASRADVPLQIIGTGPEEESLWSIAKDSGANVEFKGYMKGQALHEAIRLSRAVVLPSEWYENAPLSIMEAYALGKPIIGAAIGGIPELIREDVTGATFQSGSVDDLAAVLSRFSLLPDDQISIMGCAGRLWMDTEFSIEHYTSKMLELYKGLGVS